MIWDVSHQIITYCMSANTSFEGILHLLGLFAFECPAMSRPVNYKSCKAILIVKYI
jgi:hypothetical protein